MEFNNETLRKAIKIYLENEDKAIDKYGPIEEWNISKVTNMNYMFYRATDFNHDISKWNTSNVTDMCHMFYNAISFKQDISD